MLTTTRFWIGVVLAPFALLWVAGALLSAVTPIFGDHVEPTVVNATFQWLNGRPLYHPLDGPYVYQMLYGPADYLSIAAALKCCADPIIAAKLVGAFWALADVALLLVVFWRIGGLLIAVIGIGLVAAPILGVSLLPFWDRPDPIIFFATGLGLLALELRGRVAGSVVLAVAFALAFDSKLHAFLYLLPILGAWWRRHGFIACVPVAVLALVLAATPFLLPGVSAKDYAGLMHQIAHQPLRRAILFENIEALVLLFVPLALVAGKFRWSLRRDDWPEESVLCAALVATSLFLCVPASKDGAGPHHLLPLAILISWLVCRALARFPEKFEPDWNLGLFAFWLLFSVCQIGQSGWLMMWHMHGSGVAVQDDLRQLLTQYPPAQIQMGVGGDSTYNNTFYSPLVYRSGQPRVLDPAAYMDMQVLGAKADQLKHSLAWEEFRYWLIPAGDRPFTLNSYYNPEPLFDDETGQLFAQHYNKVATSRYFDVYEAKGVR